MKIKLSALLGSALLCTGIASAIATAPVNAATFACSPTVASKVSGTSACEVSDSANQDFLNSNPMTVNKEKFFNITDWVFGGKIDENTGYNGDGEGKLGTWDISSVFQNSWDDVMLVFKSGNGTFLTGYLLQDGVTSGTWSSPFTAPNGNIRDVSHISVYYTEGEETRIPEPATLFGLGVVGSGMLLSRRRKSTSC